MRRSVLVVTIVVATTLFALPAASPAGAAVDPIEAERACILQAQAAGASPAASAAGCLGADWSVTASDSALAADCVQAVQVPWKFAIGVISWGTLIICGLPFVGTGAGTLYWNGLPIAASAGPSTIPASSIQFWTTYSPCVLTGTYQSSVLAVAVMTNGQTAILGSDASSTRFLACP